MSELHFDLQENCTRLSLDQKIYLRILDTAIKQTTADILQLKESFAQADIDKIQSISHRLKGDYANLYIQDLSTIAKGINDISKSEKNLESMRQLFERFNEKFDLLTGIIQKLKQN